MSDHAPLRMGINACPTGRCASCHSALEASSICNGILAQHLEFISVCPEQATDRGADDSDYAMACLKQRVAQQSQDLCGFILMDSSGGTANTLDQGSLATTLAEANPGLPLEQEIRLKDPILLENFITRVYAYARWRQLQRQGITRQALIQFHQRYKYQLMATHREQYQALGRAVAESNTRPLAEFAPAYIKQLMLGLKQPATRGSHCNVLQHLAGYLKRALSAAEKQQLQQLITRYRTGLVPLAAPIGLLKQHFQQHPHPYITDQAYLQPHPDALGLLNSL